MKKIITAVILSSVIQIIGFMSTSSADEAIFCVSEENRYVVLIDGKDKCFEEEAEIRISGSRIKTSEGLVPLANFATNEACGAGTAGMRTDVGFDYNSNGKLDREEILTTALSCRSM